MNYKYPAITKGEILYFQIREHIQHGSTLKSSPSWFDQFDRGMDWIDYIEEFMTLNICGQIVKLGKQLRSIHSNSTVFSSELRSFINDSFTLRRSDLDRLFRLSKAAVDSSMDNFTRGTKNVIRKFAEDSHRCCYLCGRDLDFADDESDLSYTADHIWPHEFGGDSVIENLLPCCKDCNNAHKKNYPTWAMTNVHELIKVDESELSRTSGTSRFAIHHRFVQKRAIEERISLKDSYLLTGPSRAVVFSDKNCIGHFFNLSNCDE